MTVIVRPQAAADRDTVQDVVAAAFAGPDRVGVPIEVELNAELGRDPSLVPALTLVAERDGRVVGQLTSSYGTLTGADGTQHPMVGVGPVAVLPQCQGGGIGRALLTSVIDAARAAGEPALVLLGDPAFYGRFGFLPAADIGIAAPDPSWGRYFQALPLRPRAEVPAGSFRYAAPFERM